MQLHSLTTGASRNYTFSNSTTPGFQSDTEKTTANGGAFYSSEEFVASNTAEAGLIPANAAIHQGSESSLRTNSPLRLEAQSLGEQVAAAAVPGLGLVAPAKSGGDKVEILALFDRWNDSLQTRDPDKMLEHYAPDAILLPTLSNKVRHNHAEIKDYFEHFLPKGPKGKIDESNVRLFGDVAINSGVYTFDFANGASVQARYTYVYRKLDGEWKIAEHHSSAMPETAPHILAPLLISSK
jgi:uncharacterized protein (TIGR02246 family)